MPCTTGRSLPFWLALGAAAFGAVLLATGRGLSLALSDQVWNETVRPLLIASLCVALAVAASLAYGGKEDDAAAASSRPPAKPGARFQRPALWTVVALSLLALLLRGF